MPKLFDKRSGCVDGVSFTVYENGLLKVGTTSSRKCVRLKEGQNVEEAVRQLAACQREPASSSTSKRPRTGEDACEDEQADATARSSCHSSAPRSTKGTIERFIDSEHATKDSYWSRHLGARHERTRPEGESYEERGKTRDEACTELDRHREQLSQLRAKLCELIEAAVRDSPVEGEPMQRTAAVLLHAAISEVLGSAEDSAASLTSDQACTRTTSSVPAWAGAAAESTTTSSTITARWGGAEGPLGELRLLLSELMWIPMMNSRHRAASIPLATVECVSDEDDVSAVLIIELVDGDRICLDFGSTGRALSTLIDFEAKLHAACDAARASQESQPKKEREQPIINPPAAKETRRMKEGRELRAGLQEVSKLKSADRTQQAQTKLKSLSSGKEPSQGTVNVRAFGLASELFKVGNLELTQAVLDKFLSLRDVKQLLPEAVRKTRLEVADAATAAKLLATAKEFFTVIMKVKGKGKGRRTDTNMNAFWASAASLLPRDVFHSRHGRAAARLLGIPHRVIKRASAIRADLEDSGVGWKLIKTSGHSDTIQGRLIAEFFHTEVASTEDNQNKQPITVFDGIDEHGDRRYAIHWRRAQNGGWKQLVRAWRTSPQCAELKRLQQVEYYERVQKYETQLRDLQTGHSAALQQLEAQQQINDDSIRCSHAVISREQLLTHQAAELQKLEKKAPKKPKIIEVGRKLLRKFRCLCIKPRGPSECDDTITTFVTINLPVWHRARQGYHHPCSAGDCHCHICSNPELRTRYRGMSASLWALQDALLPCGKTHFEPYDLPMEKPFKAYRGCCVSNKCPRKRVAEQQRAIQRSAFAGWATEQQSQRVLACGWDNVFGEDCPRECSDATFKWHVWAPQLRGTNEEGRQSYSPELIPKRGTRAEFMAEFRAGVETMLPHLWRDKMLRRGLKVHEAKKGNDTATLWSDYAAQFETKRAHTATCAVKERHNNCVTVVGHSPYVQRVEQKAHGQRPAKTFDVRKQEVDVFFGMFKAGYKPDARAFNVQREDITSILKHGRAIHGEWFYNGGRLPGGKFRGELPESLQDMDAFDPRCPNLTHEVDVTDGCACQFAGRNNFHQTAEWKVKTGVDRNHLRLETMMGKGCCDGYSNLPASTVRSAIADGELINPGTRELVLFNAIKKPTPSAAKAHKHGWWAASGIFYGFFDTRLFTKEVVPEAEGFDGSSQIHQVVGLCEAAETAQREGPIWVRGIWCGCTHCSVRNFRNCLMKDEFGLPERKFVPRMVEAIPRQPRGVLLREFAQTLHHGGQVVAVHAARADAQMEGSYWLARICSAAFQAPADELNASDHIEAGWWVVKAQWYRLVQESYRGYCLESPEFTLVVNHIIRIQVEFDTLRHLPTRRGLSFLSEPKHNAILSSVADIREWHSA